MRALFLLVLLAGTAAAQPSRSSAASANDRAVSDALASFDVGSDGAAWDAVPAAFAALYPDTRYGQTLFTRVQARAIAFTAVTLAAGVSTRGPNAPQRPDPLAPPSAQTAQERARDLAFRFLASVPSETIMPPGPDQTAAVALGTEAAGAAGAAGCTALATAVSSVTSRLRSGGFVSSRSVTAAQQAAGECR